MGALYGCELCGDASSSARVSRLSGCSCPGHGLAVAQLGRGTTRAWHTVPSGLFWALLAPRVFVHMERSTQWGILPISTVVGFMVNARSMSRMITERVDHPDMDRALMLPRPVGMFVDFGSFGAFS